MIVFSLPPGRRRRAGDPGSAGGFAEASVWTSSSGADALRRPRKDDHMCHPPMKVSTQRAPHGDVEHRQRGATTPRRKRTRPTARQIGPSAALRRLADAQASRGAPRLAE